MELASGKKMCLFSVVFVASFAKLSSQKIIQVPQPYLDYGEKLPSIEVCSS